MTEAHNKPLITFLSLFLGDQFTNKVLITTCTLENNSKISTHLLLHTSVTEVIFIDETMVCYVCNVLKIYIFLLSKPKLLKNFYEKPAKLITYVIYSKLTVQGHYRLLVPILIF